MILFYPIQPTKDEGISRAKHCPRAHVWLHPDDLTFSDLSQKHYPRDCPKARWHDLGALNILDCLVFVLGSRSVHCRMLSCIPGWTSKMSPLSSSSVGQHGLWLRSNALSPGGLLFLLKYFSVPCGAHRTHNI